MNASRPLPALLVSAASLFMLAGADVAFASTDLVSQPQAPAADLRMEDAQIDLTPGRQPFGTANTSWITVGGGISSDLEDRTDGAVYFDYSYFVAKNIELIGELSLWYLDNQEGSEAGLNPAVVFRWHFYNEGKWSLFADLGVGVMFSTDDVPDEGTSVNFTPRVGAGFTRELADNGLRLQVGVRWAHISNARIQGNDENPSRDSVMLFAGLMWPF